MVELPQENAENLSNQESSQAKENLRHGFSGFMGGLRGFIRDILDIRHKTDKDTAEKMIKEDVPFKGHTAWILVCSIFICSIGLNANSAPVVIGAMLISPLMGPILGLGLSIAMNDLETLNKALVNFGVMVILSVFTAFLFFFIFPLREESSELLSRTAPDIRDVLIAFFGGLALIIARTKKGTIASVIFGVAIGTALMPPLCTAGFGLAIGKFNYFFGALYLFIINTIFIALATYLVLKLLKFKMVKYVDSVKRRRIAQAVSFIAFLVMIPAMWTFYQVFQKSLFMKDAQDFIREKVEITELPRGGVFLSSLNEIVPPQEGESVIKLFFMGDDAVPENVENTWRAQKQNYRYLKNTNLIIEDGVKSDVEEKFQYIQELYQSKKAESASKDERIKVLEDEVARLSDFEKSSIPFTEWSQEARINYENLSELGFYNKIRTDFEKVDTIPVFTAQWKEGVDSTTLAGDILRLQNWLAFKMQLDSVEVIVEK